MTDKATAAPRKAKLRCIRSDCVPVLTSSGFAAGPRVRIPLPPAVSQGRTRPRGLALLEATIVSERPMMGVFNNLVVFDQHVKQNSLNSIVPDLADEVGPTLLQRQRERSRPAGPCQRS